MIALFMVQRSLGKETSHSLAGSHSHESRSYCTPVSRVTITSSRHTCSTNEIIFGGSALAYIRGSYCHENTAAQGSAHDDWMWLASDISVDTTDDRDA